MKKIAIAFLITVSAVILSACSTPVGVEEGNTQGFSREMVIVGGDKFSCTFYQKGYTTGTMDCVDVQERILPGEYDTKNFTREIVTVSGEQLDCVFYQKGYTTGMMACFPVES